MHKDWGLFDDSLCQNIIDIMPYLLKVILKYNRGAVSLKQSVVRYGPDL